MIRLVSLFNNDQVILVYKELIIRKEGEIRDVRSSCVFYFQSPINSNSFGCCGWNSSWGYTDQKKIRLPLNGCSLKDWCHSLKYSFWFGCVIKSIETAMSYVHSNSILLVSATSFRLEKYSIALLIKPTIYPLSFELPRELAEWELEELQ